jgi:hypothetical protein
MLACAIIPPLNHHGCLKRIDSPGHTQGMVHGMYTGALGLIG